MLEQGLIESKKPVVGEQQFAPHEVRQLKIAVRLQRDLGMNLPGAALALDLLTELQEMRALLNRLEKQLRA